MLGGMPRTVSRILPIVRTPIGAESKDNGSREPYEIWKQGWFNSLL